MMERLVRLSALLLLATIPAAMFGVGHAIYLHLAGAGVLPTFSPVHHPEALVSLLAGGFALISAVGLGVALVRWLRLEREVGAISNTAPIRVIAGEPVKVVPFDSVELFAAGLRDPAIFASQGALAAMTGAQLRAAVLHERCHLASGDIRFRFVLSALRLSLGWLPPVRRAVAQAILHEECRADAFALRAGIPSGDLAEAILAVNALRHPAPALGEGVIATRLQRLADPATRLPGLPALTFTATWAAVALLPVFAHIALAIGM